MKKILKIKLLSFIVFLCFYFNVHGQNSYIGEISGVVVPPRYTLETGYFTHILTLNSNPIPLGNPLIVNGIEYFFGDIVEITGYPTGGFHELEIETIEKWSLNQNAQRFLGRYLLECECINQIHLFDTLSYECSATIKEGEGIESDLLTDIEVPVKYKDLTTFTFNNVFFIPRQENEERTSFQGGGEIKNDTLLLNFSTTIEFKWVACNCKGKKKDSLGIVPPPESSQNKVYYDATNRVLVIDKTLQNQFLTLELYDMQGKVILNRADANTISVAHLPNGIYLYRLLENNRAIYSGKILKNN